MERRHVERLERRVGLARIDVDDPPEDAARLLVESATEPSPSVVEAILGVTADPVVLRLLVDAMAPTPHVRAVRALGIALVRVVSEPACGQDRPQAPARRTVMQRRDLAAVGRLVERPPGGDTPSRR